MNWGTNRPRVYRQHNSRSTGKIGFTRLISFYFDPTWKFSLTERHAKDTVNVRGVGVSLVYSGRQADESISLSVGALPPTVDAVSLPEIGGDTDVVLSSDDVDVLRPETGEVGGDDKLVPIVLDIDWKRT